MMKEEKQTLAFFTLAVLTISISLVTCCDGARFRCFCELRGIFPSGQGRTDVLV